MVVVLALTGAVVVAAATRSPGPVRPPPAGSGPVAAELVGRWRAWRDATYRAVASTVRTGADGTVHRFRVVTVQRPPDRVVRGPGDGDLVAWVDGVALTCADGPTGPVCRQGPAPDFGEWVAGDTGAVAELLRGPDAPYAVERVPPSAVTTAPGAPGPVAPEACYRLRLRILVPAPRFGRAATVCFAAAPPVAVLVDIDHGTTRETTTVIELDARVSAEDLRAAATV